MIALGIVILVALWVVFRKTRITNPSASYPVFPGTTPEESETDDTLDEIADLEDEL
jgi:hypothetical protein